MRQIAVLTVIAGFPVLCQSCFRSDSNHPVLKVSLRERSVSISELFRRIDVIPLATTRESAFSCIERIDIHNDTVFLFDRTLYALYLFGPDGRFIGKIHHVGRGPGEYVLAYDFAIDSRNRSVYMLNPMGTIIEYGFDGTFIKESTLPKPPMNYRYFELLDSCGFVTWSSVHGEANGSVNVIVRNKLQKNFFPHSSIWGSLRYGPVFNKYKNRVYYHETLSGRVYSIAEDDYRIAYEWDTGVRLMDPEELKVPERELAAAQEKLFADFQSGTIPFFFGRQLQSERYYYTLLTFSDPIVRKSLFYDKLTGENRLFAKTVEGIALDLKYMNDDFALGFVDYAGKDALKGVVSEKDAALLDTMRPDDNPWLVKYVIK